MSRGLVKRKQAEAPERGEKAIGYNLQRQVSPHPNQEVQFMDLPKNVFFEGKIVPFEEAKISVATHAFNYGTAVFGGIGVSYIDFPDDSCYYC